MKTPQKLLSQMALLKSDYRTFFIRYWYEEDAYDYMDERDIYYIGDGHTLACGDIFLGLETIEEILRLNIPRDVFHDYYWHDVENHEREDIMNINLENYSAYRQRETHEQIVQWLEDEAKKRNTPEYKAECEASLKKIVDEGRAELEKYINNQYDPLVKGTWQDQPGPYRGKNLHVAGEME